MDNIEKLSERIRGFRTVTAEDARLSSTSSELINFIESGLQNISVGEEGFVELFQPNRFIVVTGPIWENRVGFYRGIVYGFEPTKRELKVTYMNFDNEVWDDSIKDTGDKEVRYKWGIVEKPE